MCPPLTGERLFTSGFVKGVSCLTVLVSKFTGCHNDFTCPCHRGGSWQPRGDLLPVCIHPPWTSEGLERFHEPLADNTFLHFKYRTFTILLVCFPLVLLKGIVSDFNHWSFLVRWHLSPHDIILYTILLCKNGLTVISKSLFYMMNILYYRKQW